MNEDTLDRLERESSWDIHILEYEDKKTRDENPIPMVRGPANDENGNTYVPNRINNYFLKRYGPEVKVDILNRFGKEDGSGYSYAIFLGDNQKIAEMEAVRKTVYLPPGYEGHLIDEINQFAQKRELPIRKDVKPEEFTKTLWQIKESPQAIQLHRQIVQTTSNATKI